MPPQSLHRIVFFLLPSLLYALICSPNTADTRLFFRPAMEPNIKTIAARNRNIEYAHII